MAKLVFLILITVLLTLANTTSVMAIDANGIIRHDDIIRLNDKLEREESEDFPDDKFMKYSIINQVNSTKLKDSIDALSSFNTRHTKSVYIENVTYRLENELQSACSGGTVYFHNFTQIDQGSSYDLKNIICDKFNSTSPYDNFNHLILIIAHYDSRMQDINQSNARAPGADDDASGVAAVLELARILTPLNLKNNIQFVLFSGEEQGQWGSTAYVKHLQANDIKPDLVINLDMIGYPSLGLGKVAIEYDQGNKSKTNDKYSKEVGEFIKKIASKYTKLEGSLSALGKTDLVPFEAAGFTVIGLHDGGSEHNPHYHSISDTPATLNIEYLTSITQLALATILDICYNF
jgi:Peptidase family M28